MSNTPVLRRRSSCTRSRTRSDYRAPHMPCSCGTEVLSILYCSFFSPFLKICYYQFRWSVVSVPANVYLACFVVFGNDDRAVGVSLGFNQHGLASYPLRCQLEQHSIPCTYLYLSTLLLPNIVLRQGKRKHLFRSQTHGIHRL